LCSFGVFGAFRSGSWQAYHTTASDPYDVAVIGGVQWHSLFGISATASLVPSSEYKYLDKCDERWPAFLAVKRVHSNSFSVCLTFVVQWDAQNLYAA
jgi:hypothetical protein